jgi:hypothetical protein
MTVKQEQLCMKNIFYKKRDMKSQWSLELDLFILKPGLHYQSFCDHSSNFAYVNSKF